MDNYKGNFIKKISFLLKMVSIYGEYRVPEDWFDVAVVAANSEPVKPGKIHEARTSFHMKSLLVMYKRDFEKILKAHGHIEYELDKKRHIHIFRLKK